MSFCKLFSAPFVGKARFLAPLSVVITPYLIYLPPLLRFFKKKEKEILQHPGDFVQDGFFAI